MCTGQEVALASTGLQAGGLVTSTLGSYYTAKSERISLQHRARMADIQARVSELKAKTALRKGQVEEQKVRLAGAKTKSSQRASFAARGIDIGGSGIHDSAANVLTTTDLFTDIDADTVAFNAAREAWGYRNEAVDFLNQSGQFNVSARAINPWMSATTTLLTGASSLGSNFANTQRNAPSRPSGGSFSGGASFNSGGVY